MQSSIRAPRYLPEFTENVCPQNLHVNIYSSFIYQCGNMEVTMMCFSQLMDKNTVVQLGRRTLSSAEINELCEHGETAGTLGGEGCAVDVCGGGGGCGELLVSFLHEGTSWSRGSPEAPSCAGQMLPMIFYAADLSCAPPDCCSFLHGLSELFAFISSC
ncbi:hypothetical protein HJG60_008464 [Phyllostomus discolor]|uniref:Uncharacterized protein n=1 Tax=Phyllostomus discolor TaxID=89673 RepID=A0A834DNE0_9CHIR|nr:hypothetical protein HJG60_008464 [Phyllostomus discolor]